MGLMSFLTGGSKQKSESQSTASSQSQSTQQSSSYSNSRNLAFDFLQSKLGDIVGRAGTAAAPDTSIISSLLGYGSADAGQAGFDRYKSMSGFDFLADRGAGGIVGNAAASGLLNSGSTQKALANFGSGIQNQFLSQYLNQLFGLADVQQKTAAQEQGVGLQAADILRGAGQYSQSASEAYGQSTSQSNAQSTSKGTGSSSGGLVDIFKALKPSGA